MSNFRKHIDDFFREKLGRYRETPPADVWGDLEGRLDGLKPAVPGTPYRWLWHLGIVSVILILGISVGRKMLSDNHADSTKILAANEQHAAGNPQSPATVPANPSGTDAGNIQANPGNATQTPVATTSSATATSTENSNTGAEKQPANANRNNTAGTKPRSGNHKPALTNRRSNSNGNSNNTNQYQTSLTHTGNDANTTNTEVNINNEYAASPSNSLSSGDINKNEKQDELPKANKNGKDAPKNDVALNNKDNNKKSKPAFLRFEAGVKLGFEGGYEPGAAYKAVVSPYVQYNLSPRLSVMLQPALKAAGAPDRKIGTPQSYYRTNEDAAINRDWIQANTVTLGTEIDTISYTSKYTYSQTHDSIVKSYKTGGTYMEAELPILLKYALSKKLSVYGGVNLVYTRQTGITENTFIKKGIYRSMDSTFTTVDVPLSAPAGMGLTYNGTPYSSYNGPLYREQATSMFRTGYMIGFSYALQNRWLIDALMQQTPGAVNMKGGYNVNTPLSTPYFRLSVGYKLTK